MTGLLQQINRSNGGLPKFPVAGSLLLTREGIEGDRQSNLKYHGGPDKAVLMISAELVDNLAAHGFPVYYGALGENLTIAGLDPHQWRQGQRYRVGEDAVIELTTLRVPCSNLHIFGVSIKAELYDTRCKAGDIASPRWGNGGIYARVIRPGLLIQGAPVALQSEVA